jgi:hypothetical protein
VDTLPRHLAQPRRLASRSRLTSISATCASYTSRRHLVLTLVPHLRLEHVEHGGPTVLRPVGLCRRGRQRRRSRRAFVMPATFWNRDSMAPRLLPCLTGRVRIAWIPPWRGRWRHSQLLLARHHSPLHVRLFPTCPTVFPISANEQPMAWGPSAAVPVARWTGPDRASTPPCARVRSGFGRRALLPAASPMSEPNKGIGLRYRARGYDHPPVARGSPRTNSRRTDSSDRRDDGDRRPYPRLG